ncbi:MAG: ankyrin repeat domain-containing protein [Planctomycetes bacterium]|nr:ankyrin repeat domain-containing protein [Planctomycetota bacterium]
MYRQFLSAWGAAVLLLVAQSAMAESKSPLADAAEEKDSAVVAALLEQGADVNAAQPDGMAALHWAVYHDDLKTAKILVGAGANVQAENRYAPLSLACSSGDRFLVELLLDAGADPNTTLAGGETALMTASRTGRLGPVQALLERGADVDAKERKGQTALMWAAAEGHEEVVDALLDAGADFRKPLSSGFTPLFFAVREGRTAVVLRLLAAGADVNEVMQSQGGVTPLILAVENGHFELAAALLDAGAAPNDRPAGYTALHAMTWVRKPIRGDGDPPPLGSGILSSLDIVRRLAAHGADLDARLERGASGRGRFTTTGSTPFLLAARASDVPLMRLLVELGADWRLPNADNSTPLLAAAGVGALGDGEESAGTEEEAVEAVRLLLDLGADVNAADDNGETAMHGAAYQSRSELVEFLAERGADVAVWNRKNKWGWTPLLIAQGHRPGNFRPAPETIAAIERVMLAAGVTLPEPTPRPGRDRKNY